MGYTTDFIGEFEITPPLNSDQVTYLKKLCNSRRVRRDVSKLPPDPYMAAVGLDPGFEGEHYVASADDGNSGQSNDPSVIDGNCPPGRMKAWEHQEQQTHGQPSLWCQWEPSSDGAYLAWDENEKFYEYETWLQYYIDHFFKPWGVVLNGDVEWQGEDSADIGMLSVKDNMLTVKQGKKVYE